MTQITPTMDGFQWSRPAGPPPDPVPSSDGWCIRDSCCQPLGWPPGSRNGTDSFSTRTPMTYCRWPGAWV